MSSVYFKQLFAAVTHQSVLFYLAYERARARVYFSEINTWLQMNLMLLFIISYAVYPAREPR